jgi:hypothetical protein
LFSIKKIITSVVLVFLTLILIAIIFGSSSYTGQTVNNKEIMTLTTMKASIIETTYKIKTTTILTSTTTEQLKGVVQKETNSDCEALGCPSGTMFVGSKTSKKYHNCDCTWTKKISQQNLVCFKSIEEAQNSGYVPCKVCKPQ